MADGEGGDPGASEGFVTGLFNSLKDWVGGLFGSLISDIVDAFTSFGNLLGNLWNSTKDGFSNVGRLLGNLWTSVKDGFSNVGGLLGSLWNSIKDGFSNIGSLIGSLWDSVKDGFLVIGTFIKDFAIILTDWAIALFIPEEGYIKDRLDYLRNSMFEKFAFIGQVKKIFPDNYTDHNNYSLPDIHGVQIDFSWYAPYRMMFKNVMAGGIVMLTVYATIRRFSPTYVING